MHLNSARNERRLSVNICIFLLSLPHHMSAGAWPHLTISIYARWSMKSRIAFKVTNVHVLSIAHFPTFSPRLYAYLSETLSVVCAQSLAEISQRICACVWGHEEVGVGGWGGGGYWGVGWAEAL